MFIEKGLSNHDAHTGEFGCLLDTYYIANMDERDLL
jgi:hypothetical protein